MSSRFVLIAAATLVGASAQAAEPVKLAAQSTGQPQRAAVQETVPAQVVLASADDVHPSATGEQPAASPTRRSRVARVTTCRCGDPQAQPER